MKRIIFICIIVLLIISCNNYDPSDGEQINDDLNNDKISVIVDSWYQDSTGDLYISYNAKMLVNEEWDSVEIGFWAEIENGYCFAYSIIKKPIPFQNYTDTAYTVNTRGSIVSDVGPYNYTIRKVYTN